MKWYFHSESMDKELEVKAIFLDTNKFTVQLNGWGTECLYGADKLLQAHDDAIRREAFGSGYVQGENDAVEHRIRNYIDAADDYIRYSIIAAEPAREGS